MPIQAWNPPHFHLERTETYSIVDKRLIEWYAQATGPGCKGLAASCGVGMTAPAPVVHRSRTEDGVR